MRFNEDYLQFLDEYLDDHLTIEQPEPEFAQISTTETDFDDIDSGPLLVEHGYVVADENFDILRTRSATPGEAWDLQRRSCVYVVKFDTAQKLGYACDQAVNVLEILRK